MPTPRQLPGLGIRPSKTQTSSHLVEDIDVPVHAPEGLLARPHGEDGDVRQRVHALGLAGRQRAVDDEPVDGVGGVREQVVGVEARDGCSRQPRAVAVHAEVLAVVRRRPEALRQRVPRVPVGREVRARAVRHAVDGLGVLRGAGVEVRADGAALRAVRGLRREVLGVDAAEDVEAVAVVCGDEDQRVIELAEGFEAVDGCADRVV